MVTIPITEDAFSYEVNKRFSDGIMMAGYYAKEILKEHGVSFEEPKVEPVVGEKLTPQTRRVDKMRVGGRYFVYEYSANFNEWKNQFDPRLTSVDRVFNGNFVITYAGDE